MFLISIFSFAWDCCLLNMAFCGNPGLPIFAQISHEGFFRHNGIMCIKFSSWVIAQSTLMSCVLFLNNFFNDFPVQYDSGMVFIMAVCCLLCICIAWRLCFSNCKMGYRAVPVILKLVGVA